MNRAGGATGAGVDGPPPRQTHDVRRPRRPSVRRPIELDRHRRAAWRDRASWEGTHDDDGSSIIVGEL